MKERYQNTRTIVSGVNFLLCYSPYSRSKKSSYTLNFSEVNLNQKDYEGLRIIRFNTNCFTISLRNMNRCVNNIIKVCYIY